MPKETLLAGTAGKGAGFRCWFFMATPVIRCIAVTLFHVCGMRDLHLQSLFWNIRVMAADREPQVERSLVAAAVNAIDLIGQPVVLFGESLGTGVACAAASQRTSSVRGLLLFTPFDSLISVARKHYPWAPVSLILRDRYDSSRVLQDLRLPLAIIVAEGDDIVPVDSATRLFESYSGPKKLWRVSGSGHNQVLEDISDSELRAAYEFALGI